MMRRFRPRATAIPLPILLCTLIVHVARVAPSGEGPRAPRTAAMEATESDWRIAREKAAWALRELEPRRPPFGDLVAAIGESFVGTAYVPGTLEVGAPERLVVELEGLDCVTFVETALTLARLVRHSPEAVAEEAAFRRRYAEILTELRYRGGHLDGYPSRLHYFSDWIADNQRMGSVADVTEGLGGRIDEEAIDFMSTHAEAYPALADPAALEAIRAIEAELATRPRRFVPQDEVGAAVERIATGDIIAATSTVAGLDIAHTGIAVWRDGELRLLHAPLVGEAVELSETPLAERLLRIPSQDGIMVARPLDPSER
jgi:hypothetical protein